MTGLRPSTDRTVKGCARVRSLWTWVVSVSDPVFRSDRLTNRIARRGAVQRGAARGRRHDRPQRFQRTLLDLAHPFRAEAEVLGDLAQRALHAVESEAA